MQKRARLFIILATLSVLLVGCAGERFGRGPYIEPPLRELSTDVYLGNESHDVPYYVTYIYDVDTSRILDAVYRNITSLRLVNRAEIKKESARSRWRHSRMKLATELQTGMTEAGCSGQAARQRERMNDLVYECYRVRFTPPRVSVQKPSSGLFWIRARSDIVLDIGYAKRTPRKTFVHMRRNWAYWNTLCFPETEIPLPLLMPDDFSAILHSDIEWLKSLGESLGVRAVGFEDAYPFQENVYWELAANTRE